MAIAIGTPASRSACDRRQLRLAQEVERAGQQHRDGAGARPSPRTPSSPQVLEVIAATARRYARRERGAALVGQLLGVQLDRQAERARGVEHALGLRRREADALAERVDRIDQAFARQRRQHASQTSVDVVVGAAGEFGRQRMRAEEGRAHRRRRSSRPRRRATRSMLALVLAASRP